MSVTPIVPCVDLDAMVAFFVERCGARVESITPADAPRDVTVRIGDATICLRRCEVDEPVSLIVRDASVEHVDVVTAPNGLTVEFRPETTAHRDSAIGAVAVVGSCR